LERRFYLAKRLLLQFEALAVLADLFTQVPDLCLQDFVHEFLLAGLQALLLW
jgi:hypothetical protein